MILVLSLQSASRDPERSPMQWSNDMNAGFNNKTNTTWLPVHPDYRTINVEVQNSFTFSHVADAFIQSDLRKR